LVVLEPFPKLTEFWESLIIPGIKKREVYMAESRAEPLSAAPEKTPAFGFDWKALIPRLCF
jgi:hypothetical protein